MLTTIGGLALIGGWTLAFLYARGPQILLAAPAMGLMVVVLGAGTLYPVLHLTLGQSAVICAIVGTMLTMTALWLARQRVRLKAMIAPVLLAFILATVVTRMMCDTTLRANSPGILYFDGTDHLGYAQMADWLSSHTILGPPSADPSLPYESFPEILFRVDSRFGSFEWMGIISMLDNQSGSFSYDVTSAIVITVSILSLVGLFAADPRVAALLALGLLTSHWFDYAATGFFGKIMGFPASMFAAGLFITGKAPFRLTEVVIMVLAVAAAAIMYSGLVAALFVITVGLSFAIFEASKAVRSACLFSDALKDRFIVLGLLVAVATLTTGFASRPASFGYPDFNVDWPYIWPRVMDFENQGVAVSGLSESQVVALCFVFGLTLLLGLGLAVWRGLSVAVALIGGPSLLLASLFALNARATAFQLIGVAYPLALCAFAVVIESASPRPTWKTIRHAVVVWVAGLLFAVLTLSHLPKFAGSLQRYAGPNAPDLVRFNLAEMDTISTLIGASTVEVDVTQTQAAIMALVEFGRRGIVIQWSPRAWTTVLGYRPWPPPSYATPAMLCLTSPEGDVPVSLYSSPRYRLTAGACNVVKTATKVGA